MSRQILTAVFVLLSVTEHGSAEDALPDLEFLEWLGQTTEVEEMGVDVDKWLLSKEQDSDADTEGENRQ